MSDRVTDFCLDVIEFQKEVALFTRLYAALPHPRIANASEDAAIRRISGTLTDYYTSMLKMAFENAYHPALQSILGASVENCIGAANMIITEIESAIHAHRRIAITAHFAVIETAAENAARYLKK